MQTDPSIWFQQAEADLSTAKDNQKAGHYEWACFCSQQAGEKALKAVLYQHGRTTVFTHSLADLVQICCQELKAPFAALEQAAKGLDQHYLVTRYPNALHSDRPPARYFDEKDAAKCVQWAESILNACRSFLESSGSSSKS